MKKVQLILPVIAILLASFGAFAVNRKSKESKFSVPVAKNPETCLQVGSCSNTGGAACMDGGAYLLVRESAASCCVGATGTFTPSN
jgi:hypothetical protein